MTATVPRAAGPMLADDCLRDLRSRLFGGGRPGSWRVGTELEFLVLDAESRRVAPIEPEDAHAGSLALLRRLAAERGWCEGRTKDGVPAFTVPGAGIVSFEPGGQIEFSSYPCVSPSRLLAVSRRMSAELRGSFARCGMVLLEIGLDPCSELSSVPLRLHGRRYTRMAAHFARIGEAGARMMRQTASCQISLDVLPGDAERCWTVLNLITPALIAACANSPIAAGSRMADASVRARTWQQCDPARTGVFPAGEPVESYWEFALGAATFLLDDEPATLPLHDVLHARGITPAEWDEHLSVLFPDVRPRGYMEVRGCDMVGDDARAALLVALCAVCRDRVSRETIAEIGEGWGEEMYRLAPSAPRPLLDGFADIVAVGLAAAARERAGFWTAADLERASRFTTQYPRSGRAPADAAVQAAERSGLL